jgi:hypothetical protein
MDTLWDHFELHVGIILSYMLGSKMIPLGIIFDPKTRPKNRPQTRMDIGFERFSKNRSLLILVSYACPGNGAGSRTLLSTGFGCADRRGRA